MGSRGRSHQTVAKNFKFFRKSYFYWIFHYFSSFSGLGTFIFAYTFLPFRGRGRGELPLVPMVTLLSDPSLAAQQNAHIFRLIRAHLQPQHARCALRFFHCTAYRYSIIYVFYTFGTRRQRLEILLLLVPIAFLISVIAIFLLMLVLLLLYHTSFKTRFRGFSNYSLQTAFRFLFYFCFSKILSALLFRLYML